MLHTLLFAPRLRPLRIAVFMTLILAVSYLAVSPTPPKGVDTGWDKANHALAFATLLLSARLAWPHRSAWLLAAALLAYGGLIEVVQLYVPGRDGDWQDLLADASGLLLGLLIYRVIRPASGT